MNRNISLLLISVSACFACVSCVKDTEPKPKGPTSETSAIPWNSPIAGQGQGQMGMLPQNQYRR